MTKRRLTQHQMARIAKRRRPTESSESEQRSLGAEREGLVIGRFGTRVDVEDLTSGQITRCHLRANLGDIVAGDRVLWQPGEQAEQPGVVNGVLPRHSELHRPDSFGKLKLVAANITHACITIAPVPEAHGNLIDRYLVVAEHLALQPLIVVNKVDLLDQNHPLHTLMAFYRSLGYPVLALAARSRTGLSDLHAALAEGISLFVGQSGVGKSSIIKALLPDEDIKIGDLSEQVQKGRHTTTHARLYHFQGGGACIDSPGIREFGLWHLSPEEVAVGFREFRPFLAQCRFRNCEHLHEPSCGLRAAVERGDVNPARYNSFRQIIAQLGDVAMQS